MKHGLTILILLLTSLGNAKTFVYFCDTQVTDINGSPIAGTSYSSYFRDGLRDPVGSLVNMFCPSALRDCVSSRAQRNQCCIVTGARAADVEYGNQVIPAFANTGRQYCNDNPPPPPTPTPPGSGGEDAILLYHDDGSCRESNYIAAVTSTSDCDRFRNYQSVWGVKIGGQCQDISDTDAYSACVHYRTMTGGTRIYHDDGRCEASNLIATVGPSSDCSTLRGSSSAWGVFVDGQCIDIPDTSAEDACLRYKDR